MKLKPVTRRFSKILAIWIVAVRAQGETTIHVPRSDFKLHENLEPQSAEAGRPPRAILVIQSIFNPTRHTPHFHKREDRESMKLREPRNLDIVRSIPFLTLLVNESNGVPLRKLFDTRY